MLVCTALFCGRTSAIPADPTPGDQDQGKIRVLAPYLQILGTAWKSVIEKPDDDAPAYDSKAMPAARTERDRQIEFCKSRAAGFKTQAAYIDCWTGAHRTFVASIKLKETGLMDGYIRALSSAAADADAGTITHQQAQDVYDTVNVINEILFGALLSQYDGQTEKRAAAEYSDRILKAYREGVTAVPAGSNQPFMDEDAVNPAMTALNKSLQVCYDRRDFADRKSYTDCLMSLEQQFLDVIRLRDQNFFRSYQTQLRAAAAAADAGEMTLYQFQTVEKALINGFNDSFQQLRVDNRKILARPVAQGYTIRFFAAYFTAVENPYEPPQAPVYDLSLLPKATSDQAAAAAECRKRKNPGNSTARLECFIAAYRAFAATIKLSDAKLLENFITAMRRIAADADSGRLQAWQESAANRALLHLYDSIYTRNNDTYLAKLYKPLAAQYVKRFDNDYIAAGGGDEDGKTAPWDESLMPAAVKARNQSSDACFAHREDLKTRRLFWECRVAAERILVNAVHTRNSLLFETMQVVLLQAASDADAGKLTDDQLRAVTTALIRGYDNVRRDSLKLWKAANGSDGAP